MSLCKNILLFICSILPKASQNADTLQLDNRSGLRSDGLDLTTFSCKIPSEIFNITQKAMASVLKSFLLLHSY